MSENIRPEGNLPRSGITLLIHVIIVATGFVIAQAIKGSSAVPNMDRIRVAKVEKSNK